MPYWSGYKRDCLRSWTASQRSMPKLPTQCSTTAAPPATAEQLIVPVNGVIQAPGDAYTISGSTITFSRTSHWRYRSYCAGRSGQHVVSTDGSVDINKMSTSIMKDNAIRVNDTALASGNNVTIAADENAMVAGPFTLNATLTINGTFTVV